MNCIMLAHEEQQEQEQLQLMNDILTPDQAYRHLPRRPKALFRHHEALWCIQRDNLGIPGDAMMPIFRDKNFVMVPIVTNSGSEFFWGCDEFSSSILWTSIICRWQERSIPRSKNTVALENMSIQNYRTWCIFWINSARNLLLWCVK